jgi:EREBP-like factor
MVVFNMLHDAFSCGWLPDGTFAAVKPEEPVSSPPESYDDSCIDSLLASSSSSEREEESKTPTPRRREVEAVSARVWLGMYDSADGQ